MIDLLNFGAADGLERKIRFGLVRDGFASLGGFTFLGDLNFFGGFAFRAIAGQRIANQRFAVPCCRLGAVFQRFVRGLVSFVRLGLKRGLLGHQRLAILDRNLVIIGMNFVEGEEAVAVAAEIDERGLERRLYSGHFREVDIAL